MKTTHLLSAFVISAGVMFGMACGSEPGTESETPAVDADEVRVANSEYGPRVIEVAPGTKVTWNFDDGNKLHDVKGDGFASKPLENASFAHTFEKAGIFDYLCTLHTNMTGRVIVRE